MTQDLAKRAADKQRKATQPDADAAAVAQTEQAATLVEVDPELWRRDSTYGGMSMLKLPEKTIKLLTESPKDDELEIKPDTFGAVYMSHAIVRKRLNAAFGPTGWGLRRLSEFVCQHEVVMAEWALYALGHFIGSDVGEQKWLGSSNSDMSYGDAMTAAQSNALTRIAGKGLGIGIECWDRKFTESFRQRMCVRVFTEKSNGNKSTAWRRLDAPPLFGETGICPDSPNRAAYQQPPAPYWHKQDEKMRERNAAHDRAHPPQGARTRQLTQGQPAQRVEPGPKREPAPVGRGGTTKPLAQPVVEQPRTPKPSDRISPDKVREIWDAARNYGISDDEVAEMIKTEFGYAASRDIQVRDFNAIVLKIDNWFETHPKKQTV